MAKPIIGRVRVPTSGGRTRVRRASQLANSQDLGDGQDVNSRRREVVKLQDPLKAAPDGTTTLPLGEHLKLDAKGQPTLSLPLTADAQADTDSGATLATLIADHNTLLKTLRGIILLKG